MRVIFLHQRLQQKRKEKQLTQEMLAEQCDCSVRYLRDLELGAKHNLSAALFLQLVYALDVPADELLRIEQDND